MYPWGLRPAIQQTTIQNVQIPESSKEQNLSFLQAGNYLQSIYIILINNYLHNDSIYMVLGTIGNPEMI